MFDPNYDEEIERMENQESGGCLGSTLVFIVVMAAILLLLLLGR